MPYPFANLPTKGEPVHNSDRDILIALCQMYAAEEILNVVAGVAIQHAQELQDSLPNVPENIPKIDRAFLRAQLLSNIIANLTSTQTVDKNHHP